jgi:hypothetical protein
MRHHLSGPEHDTALKITCSSHAVVLKIDTWFILVSFKNCLLNKTLYKPGDFYNSL